MILAARLKLMGSAKYQVDGNPDTSGPGFGLTLHPGSLDEPLRKTKPRVWFVNSMSDLFHHDVPYEFIGSVWATMTACPQHTFQVLTKRPQRMRAVLQEMTAHTEGSAYGGPIWRDHLLRWNESKVWPLPNVWLGTSIENNRYAFRANHLRDTPAAVRFISAEPLLGPLPSLDLTGIDWLILGGESQRGARPLDEGWFRELTAMADDAGTAVFVKQMGSVWASEHGLRGKGEDLAEIPVDLRRRDYPAS